MDDSHFLALDRRDCHLYRWDFTNDTKELITELLRGDHFVFRFLEDGTVIGAGTYENTDDVWIYQESSGEIKNFPFLPYLIGNVNGGFFCLFYITAVSDHSALKLLSATEPSSEGLL